MMASLSERAYGVTGEDRVVRLGHLVGVVERVVEAARLTALLRAAHDQLGADGEVPQLQRVGGEELVAVVFAYLAAERL